MELLNSQIGQFFWKAIILIMFVVLMKGVFASAVDSWKRSHGKWISIVDEVVESIIGVAIFILVIALPPSTIISMITAIALFLWGLIAPLLRSYLGLPV